MIQNHGPATGDRMKAICTTPGRDLEVHEVPAPDKPVAEHMLIKMDASAINPGDIAFLKRAPLGQVPTSLYDIWGVSGGGTVIAVGEEVPMSRLGKKVSVYRSLINAGETIGSWCEIAQMHHLTCVTLPDDVDPIDYSGSLVNSITPYAFWKQAQQDQHRGVLVTAGTSATGIAMLGIALAYNVPIVSIVRDTTGWQELTALGAKNVLVQTDPNFDQDLGAVAEEKKTTAIFDGVGGDLLNRIMPLVAYGSTVYAYGYLGGRAPVSFHSSMLMAKSLTIRNFSNFGSQTVQDRQKLRAALDDLADIIAMPHFKTKRGESFGYDRIEYALKYSETNHGKAILMPPPYE
jgi:NADPH2:quinone reductase